MKILSRLMLSVACASILAALTACSDTGNRRIPPAPVRIAFATPGDWVVYGVSGAATYRIFIKPSQPANFPFTALTETGFGGILLVSDVLGAPRAYDLSCPVEARRDVRVQVDTDRMIAECPRCHSTYDVFEYGAALSGEALSLGRDGNLQHYNVLMPGPGGEYALVRN